MQRGTHKTYQGKDNSKVGNEVSGLQEEITRVAYPTL